MRPSRADECLRHFDEGSSAKPSKACTSVCWKQTRTLRVRDDDLRSLRYIVFAHLQPGQTKVLSGKRLVWGQSP